MSVTVHSIEQYIKNLMGAEVAHDIKHVHRVKNWALLIAKAEGYGRLDLAEAAALLHDIGLSQAGQRSAHGEVGAAMAEKFLSENKLFSKEDIQEICNAIKFHNSNRLGQGQLLDILRDADMMDLFGPVGLMRGFMSSGHKPDYDPNNTKSKTWGFSAKDFDKLFDSGQGKGDYAMDEINFLISCYDNLKTNTAKKLAKPLVEYMKDFALALEKQIKGL